MKKCEHGWQRTQGTLLLKNMRTHTNETRSDITHSESQMKNNHGLTQLQSVIKEHMQEKTVTKTT